MGYRLMPALAVSALDLKQNRRFICNFCATVSIPDRWLGGYRASTWNRKGRRRALCQKPQVPGPALEVRFPPTPRQLGCAVPGPMGGSGHPCPKEMAPAGQSHGGPRFHLGWVWDQGGPGLLGLLWGEWGPAGSLGAGTRLRVGEAFGQILGDWVRDGPSWVGEALGAVTGQVRGELGEWCLPRALGEVLKVSAPARPIQADHLDFPELSIKGRTSVQLKETQHLLLL